MAFVIDKMANRYIFLLAIFKYYIIVKDLLKF